MHVVVVGAGEVGSHIARILVDEGHEVAVIELDRNLARQLDESLDALVICGSGVHPGTLRQAGIENADLLLAVTAIDEVNLIASMTGRKHGRAHLRTVARIHQPLGASGELTLTAEDLGLDALISPELAVASATKDALRFGGRGEMRELAGGKVVLVGMELGPDSPLIHQSLAEVRGGLPGDFLVVAVQGPDGIRVPTGADRLGARERAFVMTLPEQLTELAILSGRPWHHVGRVLLVGCGDTGLVLASEFQRMDVATTVIEWDPERAESVSSLLPDALVLHRDGSDPEVLREQIDGGEADAVVVTIGEPEKSVLVGLFAASLGARKVVVRCDKQGYVPFANALGIDAVISPKRAMADAILKHLRRDAVRSTLLLGEHDAEVLHLMVPTHLASTLGRPLNEVALPRGMLVGAVIRDGRVSIGSGETVLQAGDEAILVARPGAVDELGWQRS